MSAPTSPRPSANYTFPNDLMDNYKAYCSTFTLCDYVRPDLLSTAQLMVNSSVALPMPDKINDHPTVTWQSESLTETALGAAAGIGSAIGATGIGSLATMASGAVSTYGGAAGYLAGGYAINPFLVMLFKQPEFKTFQFSWLFSPRSEIESQTLQNIVQSFRKYMLPEAAATIALKYPNIVLVKFFPDDYLFQFKPCVIRSINVDYNPGGNPAFFKTGAPAQIRLSIDLTEIEYWLQSDLKIPG